jgi:hypothetical protein
MTWASPRLQPIDLGIASGSRRTREQVVPHDLYMHWPGLPVKYLGNLTI